MSYVPVLLAINFHDKLSSNLAGLLLLKQKNQQLLTNNNEQLVPPPPIRNLP